MVSALTRIVRTTPTYDEHYRNFRWDIPTRFIIFSIRGKSPSPQPSKCLFEEFLNHMNHL